jgi:hypothetical protein
MMPNTVQFYIFEKIYANIRKYFFDNHPMRIINKVVLKATEKRLEEIDYFKTHPLEVQKSVFENLIKTGKLTKFGAEHRFSEIRGYEALSVFQRCVPIRNYEEIKPYIDRVRNGENDVLWTGKVKWFAISSGTTNSVSKYIPVSKQALKDCHFRGGKDIIALYSHQCPDTKIVKSKSIVIGGSQQIIGAHNNQYYGDLSAVIIDNLPVWTQLLKTPDKKTALIPQWEIKLEKITEQAINENVTSITGVPSWTLVLLKHILKKTGKSNISEIWPDFELFIHGGVSFIPYRSEFQKIMPKDVHFMETYNASEGFFGIQDDLSQNDMLLMLDLGIFYEFIPVDEIEYEQPTVYTVENVETDVNYAMIISTNSGLWRYLIGDTVMFSSLKPHRFKITGRIKHFINAFGEELIIDNAEKGLQTAMQKTDSSIRDYTAAPVYMTEENTGNHEWLIEFSKVPENIDLFIFELDEALKRINSDYAAKRHRNMTLQLPVVHIAKEGLFYEWLKRKGKIGGQNKVPRLSNNREYIDELLDLNKTL